jgi:hypothetical protein
MPDASAHCKRRRPDFSGRTGPAGSCAPVRPQTGCGPPIGNVERQPAMRRPTREDGVEPGRGRQVRELLSVRLPPIPHRPVRNDQGRGDIRDPPTAGPLLLTPTRAQPERRRVDEPGSRVRRIFFASRLVNNRNRPYVLLRIRKTGKLARRAWPRNRWARSQEFFYLEFWNPVTR